MSAIRNPNGTQTPSTDDPETVAITETVPTENVNTIIIRVDGSYHPDDNVSAAGFVLEGNCGTTFKECWKECPDAETSMETEAAAALAAIKAAKEYSPSFIVLYSDCQPVVHRIDPDDHHSSDKGVYQEIQAELHTVEIISVNHIPRERNRRADELAHRGLREVQHKIEQ